MSAEDESKALLTEELEDRAGWTVGHSSTKCLLAALVANLLLCPVWGQSAGSGEPSQSSDCQLCPAQRPTVILVEYQKTTRQKVS